MAEKNIKRELDNRITGNGYLKDFSLKQEVSNEKEIIKGEIEVAVSELHSESLKVYVSKYTREGKENRTYKYLEALIQGKVLTVASILEENNELTLAQAFAEAEKVFFAGSYSPFQFLDKETGDLVIHHKNKIFLSMMMASDGSRFEPEIKFEIDTYINDIVDEVDKEEEKTGRGIIRGSIPLYNDGIVDIALIVNEKHRIAVKSGYSAGKMVKFYGNLVYVEPTEEVEEAPATQQQLFGDAPPTNTVKSFGTTEFVLNGGMPAYSSQDETKYYSREEIEKLKLKRVADLEERAEEYAKSGGSNKSEERPSAPAQTTDSFVFN